MNDKDIGGVVALQKDCFPAPFPEELLWNSSHISHHLEIFPEGQFVAVVDDQVVGSASNTLISEKQFQRHLNWDETVGGYFLDTFDRAGSTLYGLDISVHPSYRRIGLASGLYDLRFNLVRQLGITRYATSCRLPDFAAWANGSSERLTEYLHAVVNGLTADRTLTPLLKIGLRVSAGLTDYMNDPESLNCAALLEWLP